MEKAAPEAPTTAGDTPLLDLDTLVRRPFIAIDGQRYDILSPSEISIIESHRFGLWGKRIEELAGATEQEEQDELSALVNVVARAVGVGVPDEVYAKLTGSHKLAIVDVFTGLLLGNRLGVAGAIAKAAGVPWNPSIGATSFLGFSASTADRPRGGWLRRLWPW